MFLVCNICKENLIILELLFVLGGLVGFVIVDCRIVWLGGY